MRVTTCFVHKMVFRASKDDVYMYMSLYTCIIRLYTTEYKMLISFQGGVYCIYTLEVCVKNITRRCLHGFVTVYMSISSIYHCI